MFLPSLPSILLLLVVSGPLIQLSTSVCHQICLFPPPTSALRSTRLPEICHKPPSHVVFNTSALELHFCLFPIALPNGPDSPLSLNIMEVWKSQIATVTVTATTVTATITACLLIVCTSNPATYQSLGVLPP